MAKAANTNVSKASKNNPLAKSNFQYLLTRVKKNWVLYLFILPAIIYIIVFNYAPLYGIQIAFKDYVATKGIWGSEWIGFKHFTNFFSSRWFGLTLWNTLRISLYSLIAGFPIPILLAIMLSEVKSKFFKKLVQNVTYIPHFISVVVLCGVLGMFFSRTGFINQLTALFGAEPIMFLAKENLFDDIYVWSGVWQGMGFASIIYFAALSGVSPELHEAAMIDGASRIQRIWHINIPTILPTIIIMLIMNCGKIMSVGFEKVFLLQRPENIMSSEIISTYVYQIGLQQAKYSFSAAVGLFNNIINLILLVTVNKISAKVSETSLW